MSDPINATSGSGSSDSGLKPWEPERYCKIVEPFEVRMSRGFLRSSPARWFPGLNSHWLPLFHSTDSDFKVLEVNPLLSSSSKQASDFLKTASQDELEAAGAWLIDDEAVCLYTDRVTRNALAQALIPNSSRYARKVMLEYICRKVAFSLQASWSGMESSRISYDSEFAVETFKPQAWIQIRAQLNNEKVNFLFGLSRILAEKLDGLWRRQLRPSSSSLIFSKHNKQTSNLVRFEIARLSVSPQELPTYLKSGNLIDLEIPISNRVLLKIADDSWLSAALCCCSDRFAFETTSLSPATMHVGEGTTPLGVELGVATLEQEHCVELEQIGAILETAIPVSDLVQLTIRGEQVGRARLINFEERFSLSIL